MVIAWDDYERITLMLGVVTNFTDFDQNLPDIANVEYRKRRPVEGRLGG